MEQKNKLVSLQLDDGATPYALEKWKIKESNTLYEHYLSHKHAHRNTNEPFNRNIPLAIPHISRNELLLFDCALDQNPSNENNPGTFKYYYDNLANNQRTNLIIAAGQWTSDGQSKKLNAKRLTAQLFMAAFNDDMIKDNILTQLKYETHLTTNFLIH